LQASPSAPWVLSVNLSLCHGSMRPWGSGGRIINWISLLCRFDWEFFSSTCNSFCADLQYSVSKSMVFCSTVAILPSQCLKAGSESWRSKSGISRRRRPHKPNISRILQDKRPAHRLFQFSREFTSHDVLWSDNKGTPIVSYSRDWSGYGNDGWTATAASCGDEGQYLRSARSRPYFQGFHWFNFTKHQLENSYLSFPM
jgi:hypothetical protein